MINRQFWKVKWTIDSDGSLSKIETNFSSISDHMHNHNHNRHRRSYLSDWAIAFYVEFFLKLTNLFLFGFWLDVYSLYLFFSCVIWWMALLLKGWKRWNIKENNGTTNAFAAPYAKLQSARKALYLKTKKFIARRVTKRNSPLVAQNAKKYMQIFWWEKSAGLPARELRAQMSKHAC